MRDVFANLSAKPKGSKSDNSTTHVIEMVSVTSGNRLSRLDKHLTGKHIRETCRRRKGS